MSKDSRDSMADVDSVADVDGPTDTKSPTKLNGEIVGEGDGVVRSGKLLWLLRHAKTYKDPPPGGNDHDRRLEPVGQSQADALGMTLANLHSQTLSSLDLPELILTSTAQRAIETVERVASAMNTRPILVKTRSLYAASVDDLIEELQIRDSDTRSIMLVGHNPTFSQLASMLISEADRTGLNRLGDKGLPTCGLAVFNIPIDSWRDLSLGTGTLLEFFTD